MSFYFFIKKLLKSGIIKKDINIKKIYFNYTFFSFNLKSKNDKMIIFLKLETNS